MSSYPLGLHCRRAQQNRRIAAVALLGWVAASACDKVDREYGVEDTNSAANGPGSAGTATSTATPSPTSAATPKPSTGGDADGDGSQGPTASNGADASLPASSGATSDADAGTVTAPPDATDEAPMTSQAAPAGSSAPGASASATAPSSATADGSTGAEPSSAVVPTASVAPSASVAPPATSAPPPPPVIVPSVLVFSKTAGYRHSSVVPGNVALQDLAAAKGWAFDTTEDAQVFNDNGLSDANVVVFLNVSGEDVLDDAQQAAMERFIQAGHGFVAVHHAAGPETEMDWAWYDGLLGARFVAHGPSQNATVVVEDTSHPSTSHLPSTWPRQDEWWSLDHNPRQEVHVLLTVDEATYTPSNPLMPDHPVSWYHDYDGGRAFVTAMGHTDASYADPDFMQHLAGAIEWASGATATP